MSVFILLEDIKSESALLFQKPIHEYCAYSSEQVNCMYSEMKEAQKQGLFLAGYLSYESLSEKKYSEKPLLHFFAFEKMLQLNKSEVDLFIKQNIKSDYISTDVKMLHNKENYIKSFNNIKQHLFDGDTYQVNFTTKYLFNYKGDELSLYALLRQKQKASYSGYLSFSDYKIVSLSPELFFKKEADKLFSKPMKGTMPRSQDPEIDKQNKDKLQTCSKLKSENIIIVDLLRNDMSRMAKIGSLNVQKLLEVEEYETLFQMTSEIHIKVDPEISFDKIINNIFPCGSITGAPKKRTMEIIEQQELEKRHIYTGSIGYILPNNDMCFNVAIRSAYLKDNKGELGVGGGIVFDSVADEEFDEVKLKASFFLNNLSELKLLETILYDTETGFYLLNQHLERLKQSAIDLQFKYSEEQILNKLNNHSFDLYGKYKIRLLLNIDGCIDVETHKLEDFISPIKIKVHTSSFISSENYFLKYKIANGFVREFYNQVKKQYEDYDDIIFVNQDLHITESSMANVFIEKDGQWFTPPLSDGLLNGIMRKEILIKNPSIIEKSLTTHDLKNADKIWLSNSVRGLIEAKL